MAKLAFILILIGVMNCRRDNNPGPDRTNYACGQVVTAKLFNIKGATIKYAKEIDEYYIKTSPDTFKLQTVAVFCNLPDSYKGINKVISFDGSFSIVNIRDSSSRDGRLRKYFWPTDVRHVSIDKVN